MRAHSGELYRYAYWLSGDSALAQDLVQETFLRAWRSLDALRETVAAKAWLTTILRREHARLYERKPMPTTDLADLDISDTGPSPERTGEDAVMRAAIAKLNPNTENRWCCRCSADFPATRSRGSSASPRRPS